MKTLKKSIRYALDWEVNKDTGDCTATITRSVFRNMEMIIAEETKFQAHVSKHLLRMYPCPGQDVFNLPIPAEYERLATVLKAFYAGVNSEKDFYYWELPEESNASEEKQIISLDIIAPQATRRRKKRKTRKQKSE